MKQWLRIFLLIWSMATICSGESASKSPCRAEIRSQVLSSENEHLVPPDGTPLLATTASGPGRSLGAGQSPSGKGGRYAAETSAVIAWTTAAHTHSAAEHPYLLRHRITPPSTRTAERYIYYLRRIII